MACPPAPRRISLGFRSFPRSRRARGGARCARRDAAQFTRAAEGADGRAAAVTDHQRAPQPFPEGMPGHLVHKYADIMDGAVKSDPAQNV